jgi:hypothetical protein
MLLRFKMAYLHFPRKAGYHGCSGSPPLKVDEAPLPALSQPAVEW